MLFIERYKKYIVTLALTWLVCLVLFGLAYFFVLGPQHHKTQKLEDKYEKAKREYESAQIATQEETTRQLQQQISELQSKLDIFTINSVSFADLMFNDISRIARDREVGLFNINKGNNSLSSEKNETANISENLIKISFDAGFMQFAQFIYALETHHPVLFVREFDIVRGSSQKELIYNVEMDVTALVTKDSEESNANLPQRIVGKENEVEDWK